MGLELECVWHMIYARYSGRHDECASVRSHLRSRKATLLADASTVSKEDVPIRDPGSAALRKEFPCEHLPAWPLLARHASQMLDQLSRVVMQGKSKFDDHSVDTQNWEERSWGWIRRSSLTERVSWPGSETLAAKWPNDIRDYCTLRRRYVSDGPCFNGRS